jgi:type II secretory pathway pseudopilin PulG
MPMAVKCIIKHRKSIFDSGFSLIEIMIIVAIISIASLGVIKGFIGISTGLLNSRQKTYATNIANSNIHLLKDVPYEQLYATTQDDLDDYGYDNTYWPPEVYNIADRNYTRRVLIKKLRENGSDMVDISPGSPDEGLKRVEITVAWVDALGNSKSYTINNVCENPNRSKKNGEIEGVVRKAGTVNPIMGATVYISENLNWRTSTDAAGEFSIRVSTGGWNIRVDASGYFSLVNGSYTVVEDAVTTIPTGDLDLTAMGSGSIWGLVKSTDGVPIEGATVYCDDETSQSVVSKSTTFYSDPDKNYIVSTVSTGTWTISASSGPPLDLYGSTTPVTVTDGGSTQIDIVLDAETIYGSVSGVADMDDTGDDSGMKVSAAGNSATTNTSGNYSIQNVSTGTISVTVNPNAFNPSYTSETIEVSVSAGENTVVAADTVIYPAGNISGTVYVTGGGDPYPGIVIIAKDNDGIERGAAVTAADGTYEINQLRVLDPGENYTVMPVIDDSDSASPIEISTITVTKGGNDSGNDFIISSAWGYIDGTVRYNGATISEGVVVIASTSAISSPPPDILSGQDGMYGGVTLDDGTYRIKVRGSDTYYVYGWYTEASGDSTSTTRKSDSGITLSGTPPEATVDLDWP